MMRETEGAIVVVIESGAVIIPCRALRKPVISGLGVSRTAVLVSVGVKPELGK
jgi:hypothetical protein